MSTPTCRTCDTKFPGKDVCKTCGRDPNASADLDWKIKEAKKADPRIITKLPHVEISAVGFPPHEYTILSGDVKIAVDDRFTTSMEAIKSDMIEFSQSIRLTSAQMANFMSVAAPLIANRKFRVYERAVRRARVRSLQNSKQGRKVNKHGRTGVRA